MNTGKRFFCLLLSFLLIAGTDAGWGQQLSSLRIKKIKDAIAKVKDSARGTQRKGYREIKDIGMDSVPYMAETLRDKSVNFEALSLICDLLGEMKAKEAVSSLLYVLKHPSSTVRASSARALGNIADPSATGALIGLLNDNEPEVRRAAVEALVYSDDPGIPPLAAKLLKDTSEPVRIFSMKLLDAKLDPATAADIRDAMKNDSSPAVRQIAAKALGGLKDKQSVPILAEALTEDTAQSVRRECAEALGLIGESTAVPALIEALKDDYKDVQLSAYYSLKSLTGKDFGRDYIIWTKWNRAE